MACCILSTPRAADNSTQYLTSADAAGLAGVSFMTINRAFDAGDLSGHRLPSGHRRIDKRSLAEWAGIVLESWEDQSCDSTGEGLTIIYARCSQTKDKGENLKRQVERLEDFAKETFPREKYVVHKDLASGLNCDRVALNKIIDLVLDGKVKRLIIEHKDRLSRGSYAMLSRILEKCGVEIVLSNTGESENSGKNAIEEMMFDAMAAMYVANSRIYGQRASQKIRFVASPELEARIAVLFGQGLSKQAIIDQIVAEGFRCMNTNNPVGEWGVRAVIKKIQSTSEGGRMPQPVPTYISSFVATACSLGPSKRTTTGKLFQAFKAACPVESAHFTPRKFIETLKGLVKNGRIERGSSGHLFYGITLRQS